MRGIVVSYVDFIEWVITAILDISDVSPVKVHVVQTEFVVCNNNGSNLIPVYVLLLFQVLLLLLLPDLLYLCPTHIYRHLL